MLLFKQAVSPIPFPQSSFVGSMNNHQQNPYQFYLYPSNAYNGPHPIEGLPEVIFPNSSISIDAAAYNPYINPHSGYIHSGGYLTSLAYQSQTSNQYPPLFNTPSTASNNYKMVNSKDKPRQKPEEDDRREISVLEISPVD